MNLLLHCKEKTNIYLGCQRWIVTETAVYSLCSCWKVVTALATDCDNIQKLTRSWYINEIEESVSWLTHPSFGLIMMHILFKCCKSAYRMPFKSFYKTYALHFHSTSLPLLDYYALYGIFVRQLSLGLEHFVFWRNIKQLSG